jgi:hypothetical protein
MKQADMVTSQGKAIPGFSESEVDPESKKGMMITMSNEVWTF